MLTAASIGKRAAAALAACPRGRVFFGSAAACNLLTDAGAPASLVVRAIGDGPLNIVTDADALPRALRGARFTVADDMLEIGPLRLDMERAITWGPPPDPRLLAAARRRLAEEPQLLSASLAEADAILAASGCAAVLDQGADAATEAFRRGDEAALERSVRSLTGLGPGLTPAGDDWLAGWLLGLRLADARAAERIGAVTVRAAAGRTTLLSRAYLECAAAGEMDAGWLALLKTLAEEPSYTVAPSVMLSGSTHTIASSARQQQSISRWEFPDSGSAAWEEDSSLDSRRYGGSWTNPLRMTSSVLSTVGVPGPALREAAGRLLARGATSGAGMLRGFAAGAGLDARRARTLLLEVKV